MMIGIEQRRSDNVLHRLGATAEIASETAMDELMRITACMLGSQIPASLAHQAVLGIEMDLLGQGWPVGRSLGALPTVRTRLGLGRPAFREAITILEARGLLDVRRGPGGGLFVAAPALEDVVGAVLMYLARTGETFAPIDEFRLLVWRMIVNAAVQRGVSPPSAVTTSDKWGFAVDLAERTGNTTMALLATLAEMLVRTSSQANAPARDAVLEAAIKQHDLVGAFDRLDSLAGPNGQESTIVTLEVAEHAFSLSGRKSAMALAARMTHELTVRGGTQEAEWETAERLGYTDAVVRQARRILQDFGIVRCRQGRKGAELAPPTAPTGVIRLLAPLLMASAMSASDEKEAIAFLVGEGSVLAARLVKAGRAMPVKRFPLVPLPDAFEGLALENLLLELSGNPLLAIVVRSLGVASIFAAADPLPPMELRDVNAINRRILQAIEAGDVGAVGTLSRIKTEIMQRPAENYRRVA